MIVDGVEADVPQRLPAVQNPHQWRIDSYICQVCGVTQEAVCDIKGLSECPVGFAPTPADT